MAVPAPCPTSGQLCWRERHNDARRPAPLGPFLNKVPVENEYGYALYHTSFREFLAERLDMEIVRERIHTAIETELL